MVSQNSSLALQSDGMDNGPVLHTVKLVGVFVHRKTMF